MTRAASWGCRHLPCAGRRSGRCPAPLMVHGRRRHNRNMTEFFNVLPSGDALGALTARLRHRPKVEIAPTAEAVGRVTAGSLTSPEDLPAFPRSAMDGYSVRASDTFGAAEGQPAYLTVAGEVAMGRAPSVSIGAGEAAHTFTGGMLARGGDAVLMVEQTQAVDDRTIEVLSPVAPGENVIQPGEDVRAGSRILPAGHLLRPQGRRRAHGFRITIVEVTARPRVSIVSTGDELVPPSSEPGPGQVRDVNTYTVSGLIRAAGGAPVPIGLVADGLRGTAPRGQGGLGQGRRARLLGGQLGQQPRHDGGGESPASESRVSWCMGWPTSRGNPP